MTQTAYASRGGGWLLEQAPAASTFTPEQITDEHRLIAQTAGEFADTEVLPALDELEHKDWELARRLLRRCGELGLLGVDVPEAYGGVELDRVASVIVSQQVGRSASFGATFGAQTNLCILPILLFGTDDQKARYLPGLVNGATVGAYALSESGSGSDALSARARAVRQPDGGFRLSGEKMWITNGGFADLFVVFAQADGDQFTAFIVERAFGGVTSGHEEEKLGLHGSSTTPLLLQDVPVPAANVLGEIGRGHKVAFNVLNFGRFKLGAMCTGGCRLAIAESATYARSRKQFGQPIASFGAIRHKLGDMTARTYALDALLYRTAGLIDARVSGVDGGSHALLSALEEFAIEASIAKVAGSETLDFVLDENVQIHGGNGFVRDYPAERHYRDARVNRIFEGTNEINRLLVPGMLMKRALKGELALVATARRLAEEVLGPPEMTAPADDAPLEAEQQTIIACKKVAVLLFGAAMERFGAKVQDEQEVLLWLADALIEIYAAESALARAGQARASALSDASLHITAAQICVNDSALRVDAIARQLLGAIAEGDTLRTHLAALRRVLKVTPTNTVVARRRLADETVARGRYLFGL
jgi:alkylation response protein AidB-like acyl-CoA dehydrogenase